MNIKELLHIEIDKLPEPILCEILDFVQFMKKKLPSDNIGKELSILDASEKAHLEEEFMNYKELYPHE